ncbi:MAG: monovalent cation/H+ antiporter complex subunit F [Endomicrobiales bacterium]
MNSMKIFRWTIGAVLIIAFIAVLQAFRVEILYQWFYALIFACFLGLARLAAGPTTSDRAAALKVISVLIISFCGILSLVYKWDGYMDIALAWAVQAFIGTIAFAKYIEGRSFDD